MKRTDKLLQLATYFEKRAEEATGMDLSDKMFRTPLLPQYQWSFQDIASTLFGELNKKEQGLQDAGKSEGPVYQLMNMMSAHATPDAGRLLSLTQEIVQKTRELFPAGSTAVNLAQHLVRYAQLLINKYLAGNPPTPAPGSGTLQVPETTIVGDKPASQTGAPATEASWQFVARIYKQIRAGQPVSDEDQAKWQNYRGTLTKRLNALKGVANRSPQQEQERNALQSIVDKLG